MGDIGLKLLKEDETIKEPYTDAELQRLLKQPESDKWTEWRNWAAVNTFLATGIRANTLVNIRICDVDFEHEIIILKKLKNRKQQIIPLSTSLKAVLELYLQLWDWESEYNLFPTSSNSQMTVHALETAVRHFNIGRGVTKTSLHLFRHTFAKNYIMAGGGMVQLQAILGHTELKIQVVLFVRENKHKAPIVFIQQSVPSLVYINQPSERTMILEGLWRATILDFLLLQPSIVEWKRSCEPAYCHAFSDMFPSQQ